MTDHIHFEIAGRLGVITLDRPKALNALTKAMIMALTEQLAHWRTDERVDAIVIRAIPGRAFCAGGDIRQVAEGVLANGVETVLPFFASEYRMNWRIHAYPKPYIALIDGIVMGGGVGISVHGHHRVVTENAMFAMPETGIGMFPDVGGSYVLSRLPHRLGYLLGLSGRRIIGADCVSAGVGTSFVPAEKLSLLFDRLKAVTDGDYAAIIETMAEPTPDIVELTAKSERLFAPAPLATQMERVEREDPGLLRDIQSKSPFAVAVTKEQLDRGIELDFQGCMNMEFGIVREVLAFPDFAEGVRALLIDKDKAPAWQYSRLEDVPTEIIDACFQGPERPLSFDWDEH